MPTGNAKQCRNSARCSAWPLTKQNAARLTYKYLIYNNIMHSALSARLRKWPSIHNGAANIRSRLMPKDQLSGKARGSVFTKNHGPRLRRVGLEPQRFAERTRRCAPLPRLREVNQPGRLWEAEIRWEHSDDHRLGEEAISSGFRTMRAHDKRQRPVFIGPRFLLCHSLTSVDRLDSLSCGISKLRWFTFSTTRSRREGVFTVSEAARFTDLAVFRINFIVFPFVEVPRHQLVNFCEWMSLPEGIHYPEEVLVRIHTVESGGLNDSGKHRPNICTMFFIARTNCISQYDDISNYILDMIIVYNEPAIAQKKLKTAPPFKHVGKSFAHRRFFRNASRCIICEALDFRDDRFRPLLANIVPVVRIFAFNFLFQRKQLIDEFKNSKPCATSRTRLQFDKLSAGMRPTALKAILTDPFCDLFPGLVTIGDNARPRVSQSGVEIFRRSGYGRHKSRCRELVIFIEARIAHECNHISLPSLAFASLDNTNDSFIDTDDVSGPHEAKNSIVEWFQLFCYVRSHTNELTSRDLMSSPFCKALKTVPGQPISKARDDSPCSRPFCVAFALHESAVDLNLIYPPCKRAIECLVLDSYIFYLYGLYVYACCAPDTKGNKFFPGAKRQIFGKVLLSLFVFKIGVQAARCLALVVVRALVRGCRFGSWLARFAALLIGAAFGAFARWAVRLLPVQADRVILLLDHAGSDAIAVFVARVHLVHAGERLPHQFSASGFVLLGNQARQATHKDSSTLVIFGLTTRLCAFPRAIRHASVGHNLRITINPLSEYFGGVKQNRTVSRRKRTDFVVGFFPFFRSRCSRSRARQFLWSVRYWRKTCFGGGPPRQPGARESCWFQEGQLSHFREHSNFAKRSPASRSMKPGLQSNAVPLVFTGALDRA